MNEFTDQQMYHLTEKVWMCMTILFNNIDVANQQDQI